MNDYQPGSAQYSLGQLRREFIERLPQRLGVLREQISAVEGGEPRALEELCRSAHSLVGAAGVHRLLALSEAARALEQAVTTRQQQPGLAAVDHAVLRLALEKLVRAQADVDLAAMPPAPVVGGASPRVAVVDDDADQALWLRSVLESAGYEVEVFLELSTFQTACQQQELPAVVIMDMVFPQGDEAGARIIRELKARRLNSLPVIFLSMRHDMAARLEAYRAGASRYLTKPVRRETLLATVGEMASLLPARPYRVLVVDDDATQLAMHAHMLREAGMDVREVGDPLQVPSLLENFDAEAMVLDMYMPGCLGPELAAVLGDDERWADVPIVYLSAETNISLQLLALDRGGDHFLSKPVEPRHLVATVGLHARRLRRSREQSQALRESLYERERQQAALDVHAIVSTTDAHGNIRYVNDRFCQISGYSRDELLGRNHRIVKSSVHGPMFHAGLWTNISQGRIWQGKICNQARNGRLYWVEATIVPFVDATGRPYQYVAVCTDVTHVVEAEERLRKILSRVPGVVYQFRRDADGGTSFPFANDAVIELLGVRPEDIREDGARAFDRVHPEDQQTLRESIELALRGQTSWQHEFRVLGNDHEIRWLAGKAITELQKDGTLLWYGYIDDATERKQAEAAVQQALRATEAASHAKSEFLASMSHELRTPLNAIIGFSQIMGMDAKLDEDTRSQAHEIENAGTHLLGLVSGLIDLARIESGKMELSMEPVVLGNVLQECLAMMAPIAEREGIELTDELESCRGLLVLADYLRLRQIMLNLLSNAVKYNRPGGSVRLVCTVQDERVRVTVVDTGPGIVADKQPRIFNAFDRLGAERGAVEGAGIGLVLTKRMTEAMGGVIGFQSVPGQGSTFWVEFPIQGGRAYVSQAGRPADPALSAPLGDAPATGRPVVLYIEDNPMNLRLMQQIFARRPDLQLYDASTAEIGMELARELAPVLILMDINLPGIDGYQALAKLRAEPLTAQIPVVAVTANAMKGEEEHGRSAGFVEYVSKPLDVNQFMGLLERVLASKV